MSEPQLIDLHDIVPDPPDGLLDWPVFERRVGRRRARRAAVAVAACVVVVTGIVVGAVNVGGSGHPTVPNSHRTVPPVVPVTRPDGPILFTRTSPGITSALKDSALYRVNADHSGLRRVSHNKGSVAEVAATPDGQRIAYVQEVYRHQHSGYVAHDVVRLVNVDGSDDHVVAPCRDSCDDLSWSPDGKDLAFESDGLQVLGADGQVRAVCTVTQCSGGDGDISWSPDGTRFAFEEGDPIHTAHGTATVTAIGVANRDGSNAHQLTDRSCAPSGQQCSYDSSPSWSPDGQQIVFSRIVSRFLRPDDSTGPGITGATGVFTMAPGGGQVHQLWACRQANCDLTPPAWSPTGKQVAFVAGEDGFTRGQTRSIVIVDTQDSRVVRVAAATPAPAFDTTIAWSPRGDSLSVLELRHHGLGGLFVYRLGAAEPTRLNVTKVATRGPLLWVAAG